MPIFFKIEMPENGTIANTAAPCSCMLIKVQHESAVNLHLVKMEVQRDNNDNIDNK